MKERIQKILAAAGVASRRHIEQMIQQGRITVNRQTVLTLPVLIDPEHDKVAVDGEVVRLKELQNERNIYVLMNKPKGVYTTNVAQGEQMRAIDLLPPTFRRVYPVGRLDSESHGLLLLTNDGELTHQLTHPRFGVAKTYRAVVDGSVSPQTLEQLQGGMWMSDPKMGKGFKTGRCHAKIIRRGRDQSTLEITLREGRNGMLRRMLARVGHKVRDLTRVRMGALTLDKLRPGEFRLLSSQEVRKLKELPRRKEDRDQSESFTAAHSAAPGRVASTRKRAPKHRPPLRSRRP